MIHHNLLAQIKETQQHEHFIYPYYGKLSIAEIVPTILASFGVDQPRATLPQAFLPPKLSEDQKVILLMTDGVGYDHFLEYQEQVPLLKLLGERAQIYPITSVFPSTTPAALTTLHTGFTPQEHGLPEWTVYFEEFDKIIETFPFRPIMTAEREILLAEGGTPEMLYKGDTAYQTLQDAGIPSYVFMYHEYAHGAYSKMSQRGSTVVAFSDFKDLFAKLKDALKQPGPAYYFVYWSHVDSTAHVFGPRSSEHVSALQLLSDHVTNDFLRLLTAEEVKDVLFLMVADHGHTSIKGEDIIYLNDYLPLEESYLRSPAAKSIHPTGSPHDVFLHIFQPKISGTLELLRRELADKAEVITVTEAVERGLFGLNQPSNRFLKRVGDILILPYEGYHVWYKHEPTGHYGQRGIHGGLSEAEMIVPFVVSPLAELL